VNGIRARFGEVVQWVERERPDVICLQEIKSPREQVPAPLLELPGYWAFWHGFKGYSGVSLQLRKETFPGRPRFSHPEFDHETRIVSARAGDFEVASIYVPNGGKDFAAKLRFLEGLEQFAAQRVSTRLVLCGDLNVAREERDVHPTLRNPEQVGQTAHERELLEKIIAHGLTDLLRKFSPDDDQLYTWWAPWRNMRQRNIGWRLDYVLASKSLSATACTSHREYGTSDHSPVQAVLEVPALIYEGEPDPAPPPPDPGQLKLL
jgi:exodeoxyribonuclease-3